MDLFFLLLGSCDHFVTIACESCNTRACVVGCYIIASYTTCSHECNEICGNSGSSNKCANGYYACGSGCSGKYNIFIEYILYSI